MRFSLSRFRVQLVLTAVWSPRAITVIKRQNVPAPCKFLPIPGPDAVSEASQNMLSLDPGFFHSAVTIQPQSQRCCLLCLADGQLQGRQSWADPRGPWSRARQVREHLLVSPEVGRARLQVSETRPEVWRSGGRGPQEVNPRGPCGGVLGCLLWLQGDCSPL